MLTLRYFTVVVALFCVCVSAYAQRRMTVGFYNVENLCDTLASPFYDDGDWTPAGKRQWNSDRYGQKIRNLAQVIDDAGFDVMGLAEIENENVLRDLVMALSDDYNYIHRTSNDSRGMDLAIIYKGDKFFPESVRQIKSDTSRAFLQIRGKLCGGAVNIIVCHLPSKNNRRDYRRRAMERLSRVVDSILVNDKGKQLIVMGDMNVSPEEPLFKKTFGRLSNGIYDRSLMIPGAESGGRSGIGGSYAFNGGWSLPDNIILSLDFVHGRGLRLISGGVFVRDYMIFGRGEAERFPRLSNHTGYPHRTFTSGRYTAGYSDHLPVFVILEQQ